MPTYRSRKLRYIIWDCAASSRKLPFLFTKKTNPLAEILEVSYGEIIVMAAIPAILYYIAVYISVDLEAVRLGLKGLKRSELPKTREVLVRGWPFLGPLVLLVFMLVFMIGI